MASFAREFKELRDRLMKVIKRNPKSILEIADGCKVSYITMAKFLRSGKIAHFKIRLLIENYVEELEHYYNSLYDNHDSR